MENTKSTLNESENGNKSKPLLSSRLFKFRAFNPISKRMFLWNELEKFWNFEDISRINNGSSSTILMQFTGFKDKSGNEIYEGDIVKPFSIEKTKNLSVIVYEFNQFRIKGTYLYWKWDLTQVEVIGNIFENPELL